jgi:adenosylhomocysteine nucleosidase
MVSEQRILLVAAEPREFSGLLGLCTGVHKLAWPVQWARSAESRGRQFWMVANGAGAARAARAVEVAVPECRPRAVVSMGFCGALDPALKIGDVVVARDGAIASIDHVATTAAEKASLRATGAVAVEMEAAGVAERAARYGLPFFCIKSVTDTAAQNFAIDFNKALRSDGHFGTIRILKSALHNPWKAFPELFRLGRSCGIATRTLGEFIAGCRF